MSHLHDFALGVLFCYIMCALSMMDAATLFVLVIREMLRDIATLTAGIKDRDKTICDLRCEVLKSQTSSRSGGVA